MTEVLSARVSAQFAESVQLKLEASRLLAAPIARAADLLARTLKSGGKVLACGNGGSAADVWRDLRVGDALELAREPANPHDANAIAVTWRGRKLGYVPRRDNAALAWGLDRGERLQARISRLAPHPNPARRIEIEVFME